MRATAASAVARAASAVARAAARLRRRRRSRSPSPRCPNRPPDRRCRGPHPASCEVGLHSTVCAPGVAPCRSTMVRRQASAAGTRTDCASLRLPAARSRAAATAVVGSRCGARSPLSLGQQVVSIGVLEIISHGSYEAQRHGDWPISMALTTVPELHCGTVKGIACLTNLLTSGVIEYKILRLTMNLIYSCTHEL